MFAGNTFPSPHGADPRRTATRFAAWALFVLLLLALIASAGVATAAADEVVVIVNNDNKNAVDRAFVVNVYTGAIRGWPDGSPVFALDQTENSETRDTFSRSVLGKRPATISAIWSQNIFTGKGLPPRTVKADAEMKRIVSTNRNAIGYILRSELDDSVRALDQH